MSLKKPVVTSKTRSSFLEGYMEKNEEINYV